MMKSILTATALVCMSALTVTAAGVSFKTVDANADGTLTMDEVKAVNPRLNKATFKAADSDGDGKLSEKEFTAAHKSLLL